jgi:hypothetical protein
LATVLADAAGLVFSAGALDEALRAALADYSQAAPHTLEAVLTLAAAGREIDLSALVGLLGVTDVWWPFSEAAEIWPPNQVRGWRHWVAAGAPKLLLSPLDGAQPQAGDQVRIWYTATHTVQDLDGAAATTVPASHETGLVRGAAGYAAASHDLDQAGGIHLDPDENKTLRAWSELRLAEFRAWLGRVRAATRPAGPPYGPGWALDAFDEVTR